MGHHIGIVENDEVERFGRLGVLAAVGCNVSLSASVTEAATWSDDDWRRLDVVVIGVEPNRDHWDGFQSLRIARRARELHPNLRIVGIHDPALSPLLNLRMAESGVSRAWPRDQARTANELLALLSPRRHEGDSWETRTLRVHGAVVGKQSSPADVLDYITDAGLQSAFENASTQADTGLSRRTIIRLRQQISKLGDLSVASDYETGGPCVDRSLPSWRSVVDYVNLARGFDPCDVDGACYSRTA